MQCVKAADFTDYADIAVAAIFALLGLTSAVRVIRQALGEIRGAHSLRMAAAE